MTLGLLFDLDGTMTDTDRLHFQAFNELLAPLGRSITFETYKARVMGGANAVIMRFLFPELDDIRRKELADRKEALFRAASEQLESLDGLPALLDWAEAENVPVGVVTNAPRANAEHMLRGLGLQRLLPGTVVGEESQRSKPDPLPYLIGLERIACPADRAVAFEDSTSGVTAASAAGIYTVGVATGLAPETLIAAGADRVITDYRDQALLVFLRDASTGGSLRRS